jgi:transcriptional regulator with XRE-family HTH domain
MSAIKEVKYIGTEQKYGDRLKSARQLRKFSQQQLGDLCDLSQASVSGLESGESKGSTCTARLAHTLGVNALWLETGEGPRDIESNKQPTMTLEDRTILEMLQYLTSKQRVAFKAQLEATVQENLEISLAFAKAGPRQVRGAQ